MKAEAESEVEIVGVRMGRLHKCKCQTADGGEEREDTNRN